MTARKKKKRVFVFFVRLVRRRRRATLEEERKNSTDTHAELSLPQTLSPKNKQQQAASVPPPAVSDDDEGDGMNVDVVGQAAGAATSTPAAPVVARPQQQQRVVAPPGAPLMSESFVLFLMRLLFLFLLLALLAMCLWSPRWRKAAERENAFLKGARKRGIESSAAVEKNSTSTTTTAPLLSLPPPKPQTFHPAIVLQYPHAVEAAVREWADRYQARRASATAELMNLLVAAVGGEIHVSAADVEEGDIDALVTDLVTSATSHGLLDPFGKGKHARDARAAYARLWSLIVREVATRGLLGDNYVVEKAIKLVLGLTW